MIGSMPIFALIWAACFGQRPKWYEYVALAMGAWLGGELIAPQTLYAVVLILLALAVLSAGTLRTARAQAAA
ncbi:hypothetical protein D9M68_255870 [compost metagenome]